MSLPMLLPPSALDAIRDLCVLIDGNVLIEGGVFRARAAKLAKLLDEDRADNVDGIPLPPEDIELAMEMAEATLACLVAGQQLAAGNVLVRIIERVAVPITDALGYPGE